MREKVMQRPYNIHGSLSFFLQKNLQSQTIHMYKKQMHSQLTLQNFLFLFIETNSVLQKTINLRYCLIFERLQNENDYLRNSKYSKAHLQIVNKIIRFHQLAAFDYRWICSASYNCLDHFQSRECLLSNILHVYQK